MAWNGAYYNGIFHFGWDHVTSAGQSLVPFLIITASTTAIGATNARYGDGQALEIIAGAVYGFNLQVNLARGIQGVYYLPPALPTTGWQTIMYWYDATAGSIQLQLAVGPLGQLQFFLANGTTTVGSASANGVIAANRGAYIQTDVTINSSAGIVKAYVDTSGATAVISNTGVNSQSSANAYFNQFFLRGTVGNTYYDDFYALDLTGSAPFNAILGPVHEHCDPVNSDSSPNQFSTNPSRTTGNHYLNVDSATTPSGADYNYDNNPGDEELYGFPGLSAFQVLCMTEWILNELDAAGARTVSPVLVNPLGGSPQVGPAYTPPSTLEYNYQPSTVDPNTSNPWSSGTVAAAGGVEMGVIVET
jgi:hypothetical protein